MNEVSLWMNGIYELLTKGDRTKYDDGLLQADNVNECIQQFFPDFGSFKHTVTKSAADVFQHI